MKNLTQKATQWLRHLKESLSLVAKLSKEVEELRKELHKRDHGLHPNQLSEEVRKEAIRLIGITLAEMPNTHNPHSGFAVAACVLTSEGETFTGVNIENDAFDSVICAERCAGVEAVKKGYKEFTALVITLSEGGAPFPCGACRQFLSQFCTPNMPVYIARASNPKEFKTWRFRDLEPHPFNLKTPEHEG